MKLLLAVAAGALGYFYYRGSELKNHRSHKIAVKEDLTRWEGEGGNVPAVATPSPVFVPAGSNPSGGNALHD